MDDRRQKTRELDSEHAIRTTQGSRPDRIETIDLINHPNEVGVNRMDLMPFSANMLEKTRLEQKKSQRDDKRGDSRCKTRTRPRRKKVRPRRRTVFQSFRKLGKT